MRAAARALAAQAADDPDHHRHHHRHLGARRVQLDGQPDQRPGRHGQRVLRRQDRRHRWRGLRQLADAARRLPTSIAGSTASRPSSPRSSSSGTPIRPSASPRRTSSSGSSREPTPATRRSSSSWRPGGCSRAEDAGNVVVLGSHRRAEARRRSPATPSRSAASRSRSSAPCCRRSPRPTSPALVPLATAQRHLPRRPAAAGGRVAGGRRGGQPDRRLSDDGRRLRGRRGIASRRTSRTARR